MKNAEEVQTSYPIYNDVKNRINFDIMLYENTRINN